MRKLHRYWARIHLRSGTISSHLLTELLPQFPEKLAPMYFGESETLRRRSCYAVSNGPALIQYLSRGKTWFIFHGNDYFVDFRVGGGNYDEAILFAHSATQHMAVCRLLVQLLDTHVVYGSAAAAEEYDHRNGYSLLVSETQKLAHLWLGRDFRRYVPGLFWGNAFSHEYIAQHHVDPDALVGRFGARLTVMRGTIWLEMYKTPDDWLRYSSEIDSFLSNTPAFFSKNSVQLPQAIAAKQLVSLIAHVGQRWP